VLNHYTQEGSGRKKRFDAIPEKTERWAEMTSRGRLFQRPLSSHRKRTIAESGQPCTSDH